MLVCYLMFGMTVCPDGKMPPLNKPYIVRDLETGTEKVQNVQNWFMPEQYAMPKPHKGFR